VKFLDLTRQYKAWQDEFDEAYHRVMDSGQYIGGEEVEAFEEEWAEYCGAKFCVGLSSGAMALYLALMACEIKQNEVVVVPANTYIATWFAVNEVGAIPYAVEPDETYCMNKIPRVPKSTKAIIPVHLYGTACNMGPLIQKARVNSWWIISDCAQAHGTHWEGKNAFGDAGAITTNKEHIANAIKSIRNHGSRKKYHHERFGVNGRLDPLQAAFLRVKLKYLDEMIQKRREIATYYRSQMADIEGLILPISPEYSTTTYHQFVIRHPKRDTLKEWLEINGVPTIIHYPIPPHLSDAYKSASDAGKDAYPLTEEYANTCLSLPIDPFMTDAEVEQVVKGVRSFE
jgi:dTDP-4-amino-4,6-dideoxygalactose transaminase